MSDVFSAGELGSLVIQDLLSPLSFLFDSVTNVWVSSLEDPSLPAPGVRAPSWLGASVSSSVRWG